MQIHTILVPVDFSPHAARALETAIELARSFGARIRLLHCYHVGPGLLAPYGFALPADLEQKVQRAATQLLDEWADRVSAAGVPVEAHLSPEFAPEAIVREAATVPADLIVMGTRGLSGLAHVLLGSVAERTLRHAPCPVLTMRAPE